MGLFSKPVAKVKQEIKNFKETPVPTGRGWVTSRKEYEALPSAPRKSR